MKEILLKLDEDLYNKAKGVTKGLDFTNFIRKLIKDEVEKQENKEALKYMFLDEDKFERHCYKSNAKIKETNEEHFTNGITKEGMAILREMFKED